MSPSPRALVAAALAVLVTSCSPSDSTTDRTATVFAAASLVEAFTELGNAFEADNPGSDIEFNFASSSDLATQILEGAPVDIFASADAENVTRVRSGNIPVGRVQTFATNALEIMVESGNPLAVSDLADLSDPNLVYITCDEAVPVGRYAAEILARANVTVTPKSFEESVKGIVNKIVLGEADAGIVYRTDVIAAGSAATGVPIPDAMNIVAEYPIVSIGETASPVARAFFQFVTTSVIARSILASFGFGAP